MFRRLKFGGISGTSFKWTIDIHVDAMKETFWEPDRYGWDSQDSFNWEFRSLTNEFAVYNVYTNDGWKTIKLGHNDIWEPTLAFLDWLHAEVK